MQGADIFLVNPKAGRSKRTGRFVKRSHARRRNPTATNPRRRKRRKNPVAVAPNPRRKHRRARRAHSRRRRNPIMRTGALMGFVTPAIVGGAGAVGLDVLLGLVPLPDQLKSGAPKTLVRIAGALLLGWGVGKLKSGWGKPVTLGALTVVAYATLRDLAQRYAPSLPGLSEYPDYQMGYVDPAPQLQAYMAPATSAVPGNNMGAYMQPDSGMGDYMNDGM